MAYTRYKGYKRRRSGAAKNRGRTATAVRNRNTNIATTALRIAKANARQKEIRHWEYQIPGLNIQNNSAWTSSEGGTNVNMSTGATSSGWLSNYTGSKTGLLTVPLAHMARETTNTDAGYRSSNSCFIRNIWVKLKISCNTTNNANLRLMFLTVKGKLSPEDLGVLKNANTPELNTFQEHGARGRVKKILYDKIIKMDNFNSDGLNQVRFLNIFRRVNTKYFYGAPTQGNAGLTGDPDGNHDLSETSLNHYLMVCTDSSTTNAISVEGNVLVNYLA